MKQSLGSKYRNSWGGIGGFGGDFGTQLRWYLTSIINQCSWEFDLLGVSWGNLENFWNTLDSVGNKGMLLDASGSRKNGSGWRHIEATTWRVNRKRDLDGTSNSNFIGLAWFSNIARLRWQSKVFVLSKGRRSCQRNSPLLVFCWTYAKSALWGKQVLHAPMGKNVGHGHENLQESTKLNCPVLPR